MKTLDRYIAAQFLKNFLLAVLVLAALFVFQALLGQLLDHEFPATKLLIYHALGIPQTVVQMTPPAALLATVLTLSGFNRTNELTAFFSIGFGLGRVVAVLFTITFMISCVVLVFQDQILPPTYKKRTTFYWKDMRGRNDFHLDLKQNKIWYRSKNLIYNLRAFDSKSKIIHGMTVYTFDESFRLQQVIDAQRAEFTPQGWRLMDGTITVFSKDDPFPMNQAFKEKSLQIAETPHDFQEIEQEVEGLRLKALWNYIKRTADTGMDTKDYEVKFHSRVSLSFIPLVMCILGVPFATRSRREGGTAIDLLICLVVTFFYWLFYSIGLSLGRNGSVPPVLGAWLPSLVFGVFALLMIAQKFRKA